MAAVASAKGKMAYRLREAIAHLRNDIDRVEFWAEVMDGLEQPIPSYDSGDGKLNQFSLAKGRSSAARESRRDDAVPGPNRSQKKSPFGGSFRS